MTVALPQSLGKYGVDPLGSTVNHGRARHDERRVSDDVASQRGGGAFPTTSLANLASARRRGAGPSEVRPTAATVLVPVAATRRMGAAPAGREDDRRVDTVGGNPPSTRYVGFRLLTERSG